MQYRTSRQEVTALVVNQKVNVPSDYRRTVRAMVHRLFSKGEFHLDGSIGTIDQLHGMLGFIDRIGVYNRDSRSTRLASADLSKKESMYRDFLLYKEFFVSAQPVIIYVATKAVVVNGNSFDPTNEYDTATHYGKHIFAQKVALANASAIDFSGFIAILENISSVIASYGLARAP